METVDFLILLLYFAGAVLSVTMTVKYFQLCADVKALRNAQSPLADFDERFALLLSLGENDEAKKLLLNHIQKHSVFGEAFGSSGKSYTASSREEIRKTYSEYLEALDMDFDFEKVDAFIKAGQKKS